MVVVAADRWVQVFGHQLVVFVDVTVRSDEQQESVQIRRGQTVY